jgi:hypothetical protein
MFPHSSDILSIRFKHTRILRIFGLLKKYLKILLFEHLRKILVFRMSLLCVSYDFSKFDGSREIKV